VINHDTEQAVRRDLPRFVAAAVVIAMLYLIAQFRNLGLRLGDCCRPSSGSCACSRSCG
jgi:hypothetical protein